LYMYRMMYTVNV